MGAQKTYRIGEVAEILKLRPSVLRFWQSVFPQIDPPRTDKGQRLYTESHITLLRRIQHLLHEQGMTIEGARRMLAGGGAAEENSQGSEVYEPDPAFMEMLVRELLDIRKLLASGGEQ